MGPLVFATAVLFGRVVAGVAGGAVGLGGSPHEMRGLLGAGGALGAGGLEGPATASGLSAYIPFH